MNPPSRVPSGPAQTYRFDVLVVGAKNMCRSPVAERLLRARLERDGVVVSSVGTDAALGEPMPRPLAELLAAWDLPAYGHSAQQIEKEMVQRADLVLTTTRQERTDVVGRVPAALHRTFTLRELERVARVLGPEALPDGDVPARLAALIAAAAEHRALPDPLVTDVDDVLDPAGRGKRAYATSFDQVRSAVDGIAEAVLAPHQGSAVGADVAPVLPETEPEPEPEPEPQPGPERVPEATLPSTPHDEAEPEHVPDPVPRATAPPVRQRHRKRNVVLVLLASLVAVAVALTASALVVMDRIDRRIERFPDPFVGLPSRPSPPPQAELAESPVTILVLGSADGVEGDGPQAWEAAAAVTDVVMLAHVSADRESAQVVLMSPDLAVDVPGSGADTLRSAFALGGPPDAVEAVEQLTDVRVDHVALSDSATYARLTEALGGVDLDLASDLVVDGQVVAEAGRRRLTGEQALLWLHGTGDDEGRADRAQLWLRAILDRLGDAEVREDPTRWLQLLSVVSGSVAVDEGLDRATMLGLLASLRGLRPGDVGVVAAPTATMTAGDGAPVLVPDSAPFAALMDALRTDTLSEHLGGQGSTG